MIRCGGKEKYGRERRKRKVTSCAGHFVMPVKVSVVNTIKKELNIHLYKISRHLTSLHSSSLLYISVISFTIIQNVNTDRNQGSSLLAHSAKVDYTDIYRYRRTTPSSFQHPKKSNMKTARSQNSKAHAMCYSR